MCEPISIGIAIGASVGAIGAAATGGDVLQGALIGGVMGGVTGGMGGLGAGSTASTLGQSMGQAGLMQGATQTGAALGAGIFGSGVSAAAATGFATMGLGGSILTGMMAPKTPDYAGYTPASYQVAQQQFNSQQIATTGSGGRQASASLAEAIKRSKQRKLTQADVGDLSIDTSSFASTGLQFACHKRQDLVNDTVT